MVVSVVSNEIMRISVARKTSLQRCALCRGDFGRLISYDFPGSLPRMHSACPHGAAATRPHVV